MGAAPESAEQVRPEGSTRGAKSHCANLAITRHVTKYHCCPSMLQVVLGPSTSLRISLQQHNFARHRPKLAVDVAPNSVEVEQVWSTSGHLLSAPPKSCCTPEQRIRSDPTRVWSRTPRASKPNQLQVCSTAVQPSLISKQTQSWSTAFALHLLKRDSRACHRARELRLRVLCEVRPLDVARARRRRDQPFIRVARDHVQPLGRESARSLRRRHRRTKATVPQCETCQPSGRDAKQRHDTHNTEVYEPTGVHDNKARWEDGKEQEQMGEDNQEAKKEKHE